MTDMPPPTCCVCGAPAVSVSYYPPPGRYFCADHNQWGNCTLIIRDELTRLRRVNALLLAACRSASAWDERTAEILHEAIEEAERLPRP